MIQDFNNSVIQDRCSLSFRCSLPYGAASISEVLLLSDCFFLIPALAAIPAASSSLEDKLTIGFDRLETGGSDIGWTFVGLATVLRAAGAMARWEYSDEEWAQWRREQNQASRPSATPAPAPVATTAGLSTQRPLFLVPEPSVWKMAHVTFRPACRDVTRSKSWL